MRRGLVVALSVFTLALPLAEQAASAAHVKAHHAKKKKKVATTKLQGAMYQAGQWGGVKIFVLVKKTSHKGAKKLTVKYTDLGGKYTYHTSRSQFIMSQALPLLRQEFLQRQSENLQLISGATYTSQAFEESLHSALLKLKKLK